MTCSVIREADRRNRLSSRTLQPTRARGLRFECFLFHLKYLFFKNPLRGAIFQTKSFFFIFVDFCVWLFKTPSTNYHVWYIFCYHNAFTKENNCFYPGLGTHPCKQLFFLSATPKAAVCMPVRATVSLKNIFYRKSFFSLVACSISLCSWKKYTF